MLEGPRTALLNPKRVRLANANIATLHQISLFPLLRVFFSPKVRLSFT